MKPSKIERFQDVLVCAVMILSVLFLGVSGCSPAPLTSLPTVAPTSAPAPAPSTASVPVTPSPGAPAVSVPRASPTFDTDAFLWGQEITLERFVELAQAKEIGYVEWFAEQNRLRIFTLKGEKLNYKNQVTQIDIPKYMEERGVKVGEGGLVIEFEI